jgi:hypothetical protein
MSFLLADLCEEWALHDCVPQLIDIALLDKTHHYAKRFLLLLLNCNLSLNSVLRIAPP